jgi:hypothetical protein
MMKNPISILWTNQTRDRCWAVLAFIRRAAAYLWASPNTLLGIVIGIALAGRCRVVDGVVEFHGPFLARNLNRLWVPAAAITLGHCVLAQSADCLNHTRAHERVHVRQYERWGPFFIPAYLGNSLWLFVSGRDAYRDNVFEVAAFRDSER